MTHDNQPPSGLTFKKKEGKERELGKLYQWKHSLKSEKRHIKRLGGSKSIEDTYMKVWNL
jgi:hypothetical protein